MTYPEPPPWEQPQQYPQQQPISGPPQQYRPVSGQPYSPGYPPGYGQPMPYPPPPPQVVVVQGPPTSGSAVASLVLGILGLVGGCCTLGIPCVFAVIFGHIGYAQTKDGQRSGKGMAIAGLVMGYIFFLPMLALTLFGGLGLFLEAVDPSVTPTVTP